MKRLAIKDLESWKRSSNRKPLLIYGARQVGKTWLMQEFGRQNFKNTLYINFEMDKKIHKIFDQNVDPSVLIPALATQLKVPINAEDTLIIFDEIQECQRAKDSLKYFNEKAQNYYIMAAGSLLGVASGSFPVGKVDIMTLYPLNFIEFLLAMSEDILADAILSKKIDLILTLHHKYIDFLKYYFYIGGMPGVILKFINGNDFKAAREVQNNILFSYYADFSKHIEPAQIPKVRDIWDSIPNQFAKDNHKFTYSTVNPSARKREYETAIRWLIDSGLIYSINRIDLPNPAQVPIATYKENNHFKIYMLDIGLLSCKSGLELDTILESDTIFGHFKGSLTEQFVLQELIPLPELCIEKHNHLIFYWGDWNKAEVDFIIQYKNHIIPIEVKSGKNLKSKSLLAFMSKYKSKVSIRTSQITFNKNKNIFEIPLYLISNYHFLIE